MATFKETGLYAQREQLRAQEKAGADAAQGTEPVATSSPNPDADQIAAGQWNAAGNAALAIAQLATSNPSWAAAIDPAMPTAQSTTMGYPPGVKKAKDRSWYYFKYAQIHAEIAAQKGAPPPPKPPPPKWVKKPVGRPDPASPWGPALGPSATAIGDAVAIDPVTGAELGSNGLPVESIADSVGAMIPGETPAAKIGWIALAGTIIYFGAKMFGRF